MQNVVDALTHPHPCRCDCFATLTLEERARGIEALFRVDDILRGWGYQPIYDLAADGLYRRAQRENDANYRGIPMRDDACVYRRLVGFAVHELIHGLEGDPTQANYGIAWGAPYCVPIDLPEGQEADYLHRFNVGEARAFTGLAPVARTLFGIDYAVYSARDVGTYGFVGGNAIVEAPRGFRPVLHWDSNHHPREYRQLARALEDAERSGFDDARLADYAARLAPVEARGRAARKTKYPAAAELARITPKLPGRNDPCICGSGAKFKKCHGANA
ncbi:MAG TPA: SEC-C metal-binding domain-containing protein [Polyangia bacterium]|nr:SEC-C metal-binding domain-containing protein [Polyangia bacterium]